MIHLAFWPFTHPSKPGRCRLRCEGRRGRRTTAGWRPLLRPRTETNARKPFAAGRFPCLQARATQKRPCIGKLSAVAGDLSLRCAWAHVCKSRPRGLCPSPTSSHLSNEDCAPVILASPARPAGGPRPYPSISCYLYPAGAASAPHVLYATPPPFLPTPDIPSSPWYAKARVGMRACVVVYAVGVVCRQ